MALSLAIYPNFFADHHEGRLAPLAVAVVLFRKTTISYKIRLVHRRMPLLLGFFLVALFIWFGENIGTAGSAWLYPNQVAAWRLVSPMKLSSWFMLMLISYTLIALMNRRQFVRGALKTQ